MRLQTIQIKDFKRFTDLTISDIPESAKLAVLLGPNGCGKSSLFDAFSFKADLAKTESHHHDQDYHTKVNSAEKLDWNKQADKIRLFFHGVGALKLQLNTEAEKKAFYFRSAYRNEPFFSALPGLACAFALSGVEVETSEVEEHVIFETIPVAVAA